MNSDEIFDAIEEVAAASGNAKQDVLKKYIEDEHFQDVLTAALNPYVTYGMTKLPIVYEVGVGGDTFSEETWSVLNDMAARVLTGNAARDRIHGILLVMTPKSSELMRRIIRKDLRAGFGDSTVNKVMKGFIPVFPYMRCSLPKQVKLSKWDWKNGIFSQEKADGMFSNVDHEDGGIVSITSRQGTPITGPAFEDFSEEVRQVFEAGTQTHGEFLVAQDGEILPREKSNGIMTHLVNGGALEEGQTLHFKVWDQIPLTAVKPKFKYDVPYKRRLMGIIRQIRLGETSSISLIPMKIVRSLEEAYLHCFELLAQGKEGTIIKPGNGVWRDGTSKDQVKLKLEVDVDLVIKGIVLGRDGTKNEGRPGSLTCETGCGALRVDVTVKNEVMRDLIEANPDDWIDRVIVVRSNSVLKPSPSNELHSLFLPRMAETHYRTDKTEADTLQQVFDQFDSAITTFAALAA